MLFNERAERFHYLVSELIVCKIYMGEYMCAAINHNLTLWDGVEFSGLPILYTKHGLYSEYLQKNLDVMNRVLMKYSKVFAVRVDLHVPEQAKKTDSAIITRFIDSLKAQVKHDYGKKILASLGQVHSSDVDYIWVKESSTTGQNHYHLCLFFNGHAYRCLGLFELGRNNLYNRIHKAWASATGIPVEGVTGLIHIPEKAQYHLVRNHPNADAVFENLFRRLSYFAKTVTKVFGDRSRHYGCSRF